MDGLIPMHIWATLNELIGLAKKKKEHELRSVCMRGSFAELEGVLCDHVSLNTNIKFSTKINVFKKLH